MISSWQKNHMIRMLSYLFTNLDLGGRVEWVGDYDKKTGEPLLETGCYRVQGNLALSRAIGDYYLKPYVSPTPDITRFEVEKDDRFILGIMLMAA